MFKKSAVSIVSLIKLELTSADKGGSSIKDLITIAPFNFHIKKTKVLKD